MLTQTKPLVSNTALFKAVLCMGFHFEHQCEVCVTQKAIIKYRKESFVRDVLHTKQFRFTNGKQKGDST